MMKYTRYRKPWYVRLARVLALAGLSFVLWASAVSSPFVARYVAGLPGVADRVVTGAVLAAATLVLIGFFCYLLDRI